MRVWFSTPFGLKSGKVSYTLWNRGLVLFMFCSTQNLFCYYLSLETIGLINFDRSPLPEPPSSLYPLVNPFLYLFIFRNMFPTKTLFLWCTACYANSRPRFSPLLFWRSQRLRNNNGSECNNWCRGAKTPGRNRRRSVLKINVCENGLTPWISMGDGGSK